MRLLAPLVISALLQGPGLRENFMEEWRQKAMEKVENHLKEHKDCDLKDSPEVISRMQFFISLKLPSSIRMTVFPSVEDKYPAVFVNSSLEWDEKKAVLGIIHESTHLIRRNGTWLCGPDVYRGIRPFKIPCCRLFGQLQFRSSEIDEVLKTHLEL